MAGLRRLTIVRPATPPASAPEVRPPHDPASPEGTATDANAQLESLHVRFAAQIREIDRELVRYLDGFESAGTHYGIIRYHFGYADQGLQALPDGHFLPRGKRLRPILCMLFCRLLNLTPDVTRIIMLATEVMHAASLAHDDIEDKDAVRWGRPTLNSLFGLEQAINAGDALIGVVYRLLLELRGMGVAPAALLDVIDTFNHTHLSMCEGQHLDLTYKCYDEIAVPDYLEMVRRKTAAPCVCIADSITTLASSPATTRAGLRRFGQSLGMLYQICDDIRGIWCEPAALGRQVGQDFSQQRASLPLIYGFKHGSAEFRRSLVQGLGAREALSSEDVAYIRRELNAAGVHAMCLRDATTYYQEALAALDGLERDGPEIAALRGILSTCFASVHVSR